ncbi:renin receptor isoform X1 [Hydra vulgaris]|uniref:renin receptor isoform X1 n=1 Tax=Hydra vulgaris TaxID=6087 RepID=UPI001F5EC596|nr:renin receptor [Hydra vulgaris]
MMMFMILLYFFLSFSVRAEFLGKFVIYNQKEGEYATLSVLNKPKSVTFAPNPGPLPSEDVSSLMALILGVSIPKEFSWNGLQAGNFFDRPNAVLMINVDAVPQGIHLNLGATEKFPLIMNEMAAEMYEIIPLTPQVTLASHVDNIFEGKSVVRSVSHNTHMSMTGASNGQDSLTSFWNDAQESWVTLSGKGDAKSSLNKHQVLKRISSVLPPDFHYDEVNMIVTLNTKGLQVSYNMDDSVNFNIFSEIVFIMYQVEELLLNKDFVNDGVPDVFTFSITTLKALQNKYGEESTQVKGAVLLIEQIIQKVSSSFKRIYNGNIFIASLTTGSDVSVLKDQKEKIDKVISSLKVTDNILDQHIPEIHISEKLEENAKHKLCKSIQNFMTPNGLLKFKCAGENLDIYRSRRTLSTTPANGVVEDNWNLASAYDKSFPAIWNIWLWFVIGFTLTVYAISVSMWYMDPGDSIIYRLTQQRIKVD